MVKSQLDSTHPEINEHPIFSGVGIKSYESVRCENYLHEGKTRRVLVR